MVVFVPILNGYVDFSSHILHLCMLYRFRLFSVHFRCVSVRFVSGTADEIVVFRKKMSYSYMHILTCS